MGTSMVNWLVIVLSGAGAVARTGPAGESRWIVMGAPWANDLPRTGTMPPGSTRVTSVVSDMMPTQAKASPAGTATASATKMDRTERQRCLFMV